MERLKGLFWGLLACLLITLLAGCRTVRYVPVETVRTDSVTLDHFVHDSVYVRDSVYVNRWTAGDTVFVDKVSVKWRYRDRWRRDTVAVVRRDSVQVPVPVEKPLGWWQQARLKLFWPLVFAFACILAIVSALLQIRKNKGT